MSLGHSVRPGLQFGDEALDRLDSLRVGDGSEDLPELVCTRPETSPIIGRPYP
jgi:hypothetical protein